MEDTAVIAGHAFLAFILVTVTARLLDMDARQALTLGVTAGLFAILPDVDILYAWKEIGAVIGAGRSGFVDAFWTASQATHRGVSHSLVTAVLGATGFSLFYTDRRHESYLVFTLLAGGALIFGGILSLLVMGTFLASGWIVTRYLKRNADIPELTFFATALAGLVSHPFGDVFTGQPPAFFFPSDIILVAERVVLHPDQVINLLTVFLLEIGLIAGGLFIFLSMSGRSIRTHIHPAAGIGLLYGGAIFLMPPPTLQTSYHFVYSLVLLGLVSAAATAFLTGISPARMLKDFHLLYRDPLTVEKVGTLTVAVTAIGAVLAGYAAYLAAYLILAP